MSHGEIQDFTIRLVDWEDPAAVGARALIAKSFRERLGAYPNTNHQHYLIVEAMVGGNSILAACSSISFAHEQALFSENYLGKPIQASIAERLDIESSRSSICEIGSLSTNPTFIPSVKRIVAYFPWFASRLGCEFALVTVTSYMRDSLAASGAPFEALCSADPEWLSAEESARWGSYYKYEPQTGIIDLKRLGFLDQVVVPGVRPGEVVIRLGCFGKVVA